MSEFDGAVKFELEFVCSHSELTTFGEIGWIVRDVYFADSATGSSQIIRLSSPHLFRYISTLEAALANSSP